MVAVTGAVARVRPAVGATHRETVAQLAPWLLAAVGLDLVLTRFLVRLAILVPKGEPFAIAAAALGRVGAAVDALVPIMSVLLLGALLVRAGRAGGHLEQATLVAVTVIAAGGLSLVVLPMTPIVVAALALLAGAVAVVAGLRLGLDSEAPRAARLGLASLAAAVALAATSQAVDASAALVGPGGGWPVAMGSVPVGVLGQGCFVAGAGLVGLAGIQGDRQNRRLRKLVAAGLVAGIAVALAGALAPATWGALAIWSLGLSGAIPTPVVAVAIGFAVAGIPALHDRAPSASVGAAIVLLAGYGLAASGLVLASLVGLLVARGAPERLDRPRRPDG